MAEKKIPILPTNPAVCADLLYNTREERLKLAKKVKELDDLETAIENFFINTLSKESTGIAGRVALVQVRPHAVPVVKEWPIFYAHVQDTGQFDLLNRALNRKAVEERWDAGEEVPGTEAFHTKKVSCTKI